MNVEIGSRRTPPPPAPPALKRIVTRSFQVTIARRLRYLAWFRLGLVTTMLLVAVVLDLVFDDIGVLDGAIKRFFVALATATCGLSALYLWFLPRAPDLEAFGLAQVAGDLALTSLLVHATGGALSAFAFLYPLGALAAALLFYRRGALLISLASSALFAAVAIGGYREVLPPIAGQVVLPWETTAAEVARLVATNTAACFAVGVLGSILAAELRHARAEVEAQEVFIRDLAQLNDAIVRSLPSGLLSTDTAGRIRSANQAAHEILGLGGGHLVGRVFAEAAPELHALAARPTADDRVSRAEATLKRATGETVQIGVSVAPLRDPKGSVVGQVLSFQDLTPIRRMEEVVRRSEHLAGIGRLAAGIAHELRNPLASVSGAIELLRGAAEIGAEERKLMGIALREVARLGDLVDGLLQYARPQPPHKVPIDVSDLVGDIVRMFASDETLRDTDIQLEAPRGCRAHADASQLRQVVWNLLRNAAQAASAGGKIWVRVWQVGDRVQISVRDSGPGLKADSRARLFEPFFTTKERGTGLGLAIARRIVEEHGGAIDVESSPGSGATFTVSLSA